MRRTLWTSWSCANAPWRIHRVPEILRSMMGPGKPVKLVFLVRLAILPIAVKNYGQALISVPLSLFFIAQLLVGGSYSVLLCWAGHAAMRDNEGSGTSTLTTTLIGVICLAGMMGLIGCYAPRTINEALASDARESRITRMRSSFTQVEKAEEDESKKEAPEGEDALIQKVSSTRL